MSEKSSSLIVDDLESLSDMVLYLQKRTTHVVDQIYQLERTLSDMETTLANHNQKLRDVMGYLNERDRGHLEIYQSEQRIRDSE